MDKTNNPMDHKLLLLGKIHHWEPFFDPEVNMLELPFHSPGYHTTLTVEEFPLVHPTYPSLLYALALLDSGLPDYTTRAYEVIRKVISLQDQNPTHLTYGIWSWFYEEPLAKMSPPDWNWADFCGKQLVQIEVRHGDRLPMELRELIRHAVFCACDAIMKRDVGPNYTNIALMGALVTLIAGEAYAEPELADYGIRRLEKLHAFTNQLGTFHEFNSPTYTVIAITELSKIYKMTASTQAKALAEDLLDSAWRMVAEHFHPATKQWSGPHSRSYSTLLTDMAKSFLQIATNNRVVFTFKNEQPYDAEWFGSGICCPHKYDPFFTQSEERLLQQLYSRNEQTGQEKCATTYMTSSFAIGVSSEEIMWNQTRPLLIFFDNGGEAAYLKLRVLHDGYDYCSAVLNSRVEGSRLLLGICFLTDGGDTHPSLDRINGCIAASDLRIRVELGGCLDNVDAEVSGERAEVRIGDCKVALRILFTAFGAGTEEHDDKQKDNWKWELARNSSSFCFDHILHAVEDSTIDFEKMGKAAFLFSLVIGEAEPEIIVEAYDDAVAARFSSKQNAAATSDDPIKLSLALKPAASPSV